MPLHSVLGYLTVILAGLGFLLTLAALLSRSALLDRLMFAVFVLCALAQIPTIIAGVADNAGGSLAASAVAPYNFFLSASMLTLTAGLAVWRGFNRGVLWDGERWLAFQAGALANLALSIALAYVGRLAAGG